METLKIQVAKDKDGDMYIVKINREDGTPYKEFQRLNCPAYVWHTAEWRMELLGHMETFIREYKGDTKNPFFLAIHWLKGREIADRAIVRMKKDQWMKVGKTLISLYDGRTEPLNDDELYSVVGTLREDKLSY